MKLFVYLGLASSTAYAKRPTRQENMRTWWHGGFDNSHERGVDLCPPLDPVENSLEIVYHEPKPNQVGRVAKIAEAMCKHGYFPDLSNGQKLKTVCKISKNAAGENVYRWIRDLPKCVTCDTTTDALTNKIQAGVKDPLGVNVFCSFNNRSEDHCVVRCIDDRKKVAHEVFGRTQKRANIDCRCKKGNCSWTTHGERDINLNGFECKAKGKLEPIPVPSGCKKSPDATCTVVTPKVNLMNSWTCRNCFRIRAQYKFKPFKLMWFNNQDYLDITFSEEIFWIKHSHPAFKATDRGNNVWRVQFSQYAMFSNKEMDFTAEVRSINGKVPQILDARSCPCSQFNVEA